jgi:hypothetical protein
MDNETGQEIHVRLTKKEWKDLSYIQIQEALLAKAKTDNKEPYDFNYKGLPNIYIRGLYYINETTNEKEFRDNVLLMFVK